MQLIRTLFTAIALLAITVGAMLFVGSLGQTFPGNPIVAVLMGVAVLLIGWRAIRAISQPAPREEVEAEDVQDLDVFFVCGDCGTELRVERIGELQVPRHCGEPMRVERRPRPPVATR